MSLQEKKWNVSFEKYIALCPPTPPLQAHLPIPSVEIQT